MQLLTATDYDHRLTAEKFLKILQASVSIIGEQDVPLAIEYGPEVAVVYPVTSLEIRGQAIIIQTESPVTACLAADKCGLEPPKSEKEKFLQISACAPNSGCC